MALNKWGRACLGKADKKQSLLQTAREPPYETETWWEVEDGGGGEGRPHTQTKPSRVSCNPNQMCPTVQPFALEAELGTRIG